MKVLKKHETNCQFYYVTYVILSLIQKEIMSSKMATTTIGQKGKVTVEKEKLIVKKFETTEKYIVNYFQNIKDPKTRMERFEDVLKVGVESKVNIEFIQDRIERIQRKLARLSTIKTKYTNVETSSDKIRTISTQFADYMDKELSKILGIITTSANKSTVESKVCYICGDLLTQHYNKEKSKQNDLNT